MEGYLSLQGTLNVSRVWAVLEGQQFSYYDDIDVHTKTPTKLRGNLQLKNAMIRKYTDNNCKYGLKIKTSIPIVKRVYIGCNDKDSWEIWFHSLARANKAHLEEEDRKFTLNKYYKLLMIPNLYADKLTPEFVEHAYETVLSKESNEDKRQELKQAYEELLAVAEEVVESKHCKAIQYDVIVKKTEEFGLGIVLGEEKARQRVVVREVNPDIQLEGISEEGGDGIHIKDALVGIDHIDCSLWYASRVRARLGDILVPKNETVTLTFERRVLDDTMLEVLNQPEEFDNTIDSSLDSNNNMMNTNNNTNNNLSSSLPSPLNRSQTLRSEPFRPTSWLLNREPSMSQSAQTPLPRGPSFSLFKTTSVRNVPSQAEYNDLQKQLQEQKDLVESLKHQLQQYEEETLRLEKQNDCLQEEQISWEEKCRKLETQVFQREQEILQIKQEKELLAKELQQKDQLLIQQLQQENETNTNNNSNNSNGNHKQTLSSILSTSVTPGPVSFSSLDSPIPITSKPSLASMPSSYTPTSNNNPNNSQQYTPYKDYILLLHQKLEQLQPQTTPSKETQATTNKPNNNNHTNYSNNNHNNKSQNNQSGQDKPILWSTIKANDSQSSQQSSKHIQQLQHKYQQQNLLIEDVWKLIQPLQSNSSQPTQSSQQSSRHNIFNIEDL